MEVMVWRGVGCQHHSHGCCDIPSSIPVDAHDSAAIPSSPPVDARVVRLPKPGQGDPSAEGLVAGAGEEAPRLSEVPTACSITFRAHTGDVHDVIWSDGGAVVRERRGGGHALSRCGGAADLASELRPR
jgi:hypothetical protein